MMCDTSLALSMVHAWLADNPSYYCTWVQGHIQARWAPNLRKYRCTLIDGHWRRQPEWGNVEGALVCACKGVQADMGRKPRSLVLRPIHHIVESCDCRTPP